MNTNDITYIIPPGWVSGIYKITAPNGHYYYGSTKNFQKRWYQHFHDLENPRIKNTYKKYPNGWVCEAIKQVEPEEQLLRDAEQPYITEHYGKLECMNINPEASIPPRPGKDYIPWNKGKKCPQISAAKKGKPNSKISEAKKGIPSPLKGIPTGRPSWNKGKPLSATHRANLLRAKIYNWIHKDTGITFTGSPRNLSLMYPEYKLSIPHLYGVAKDRQKHHKGWIVVNNNNETGNTYSTANNTTNTVV